MTGARPFPAILRALLLVLLALAAAAPAALRAQDNNIAAQLVAERAPVPGETLTLAIRFTPKSPEWHGYWANPGDAGYGMELDWQLPEGWEAGEPLYPVPQRLLIAGLMNHIYEGDYAVLVPVRVPEGADLSGRVPIAVDAQWLACTDKICVPEEGTLQLALSPDAPRDERFSGWRAAIPPMLDSQATFELAGDRLRIGIPLPAAHDIGEPHVFVADRELGDGLQPAYAAVQTFKREGNLVVAEVPLTQLLMPSLEGPARDTLSGIVAWREGEGVRFVARPGDVPLESARPVFGAATPPLWLLLLGALAGGLILNAMPCVFPILSLKALSLARAGGDERAARREGFAYTLGAVLACVALGAGLLLLRAAGENIGWAFQLQEPAVVLALLALAVAITANFAGLFALPSLPVTRSGEPAGAFATGLLAAFVATPCTGPFMAAALGAALILPPLPALALFAALGLGLALPFLAVGLSRGLRRRLPRPGPWMETFRRVMAVPMGLTALALLWLCWRLGGDTFGWLALALAVLLVAGLALVGKGRSAALWAAPAAVAVAGVAFLPRYAGGEAAAAESLLNPVPFSTAALAEARAEGRPVFIWFTADWCLTCKVNEGVAIEREATREAFEKAGVIAMRGDWTRRDGEIADFLTRQGAAGVPLYLWYEPGGAAEQLPQVLTADMLIERAAIARPPRGSEQPRLGSARSAVPAARRD